MVTTRSLSSFAIMHGHYKKNGGGWGRRSPPPFASKINGTASPTANTAFPRCPHCETILVISLQSWKAFKKREGWKERNPPSAKQSEQHGLHLVQTQHGETILVIRRTPHNARYNPPCIFRTLRSLKASCLGNTNQSFLPSLPPHFLASFVPSFLPSLVLPSVLSSFFPAFLPSFLPSFLRAFLPSHPLAFCVYISSGEFSCSGNLI